MLVPDQECLQQLRPLVVIVWFEDGDSDRLCVPVHEDPGSSPKKNGLRTFTVDEVLDFFDPRRRAGRSAEAVQVRECARLKRGEMDHRQGSGAQTGCDPIVSTRVDSTVEVGPIRAPLWRPHGLDEESDGGDVVVSKAEIQRFCVALHESLTILG